MNVAPNLSAALELVLSHMEWVIAFDSGSVLLLEGDKMKVAAVQGFENPGRVLGTRLDLDTALLNRQVVETRRPLIIGSVTDDPCWLESMDANGLSPDLTRIQSWMGVPLLVPDRVSGVLTAGKTEPNFYRGQDAELALAFAGQVAIALENARLYEQAQQEITERKGAEEEKRVLREELARAQRMESLGVLAGGVAHELNNILGPLLGYPDLILLDLPQDSSVRNDVMRIKESAERATAVVQDLLTLARRGAYRVFPLNLNSIIEDYFHSPSFAELTAGNPNVFVAVNLAEDLLGISGSALHLFKVVMNLVLNAFEAMPYGGQLAITTYCLSLDRPVLGYDYIEAGDYVVLKVSDTGVGTEDEDLGRIFEPFYTKKEMGRSGSGLGLAVVYGVVQDHNGRIDVQTQVGVGSDFIIYFPVTRETFHEPEEASIDYGGNETVLVVDDLAEQRELAARLLSSLGYRVETVDGGRAAAKYLTENPVGILVLDMIMEDDFDGLDTYREIVKIRPGQKAIVVSGFSETDRVRKARRLGAGPFVKKLYTLESIGRAVRQELDRK